MKVIILITTTILTISLAKPNGYYHQEYNYKANSQSYLNNELQHSKDDSGFYSKDGDFEGRIKPKVRQHDQHSEYINPKLKQNSYVDYGINNGHTSSYGELNTNNYDSNYGSRDLNQIAQRLENQLARELQTAVNQYKTYGGSSTNMDMYLRELEEQLRQNVTMQMQNALKMQYGEQGIRNQMSYSIVDGHLQTNANYNNQILDSIIVRLQSNLQQQLRQQFETIRRQNGPQIHQYPTNYPVEQPYYPRNPATPNPVRQPYYPATPSPVHQPYYPISTAGHTETLTTVATRIQSELDMEMNDILYNLQRRYFQQQANQLTAYEFDRILTQLKQELKNNITRKFNEQMTIYSNNNQDCETYKQTIEQHLLEKLVRGFNKQKDDYIRHHVQGNYPGPGQVIQTNPISHNVQIDVSEIQRNLEIELTRQIQAAIRKQSYNSQPANYQATYQQLQQELNANLTRQLEQSLAQQYGHSYTMNNAMIANLRNQLRSQLETQLTQGLSQSFSSHSTWSASSRYARQYGGSGQFGVSSGQYGASSGQFAGNSGNSFNLLKDDCCMMAADQPQHSLRKRSLTYSGYGSARYSSYSKPYSTIGQQNEDDVQKLEDIEDFDETGQLPIELGQELVQKPITGQEIDNSDLIQEKQDDFGQLQLGSQQIVQKPIEQEIESSNLVQQKQDDFGQLQIGSQQKQEIDNLDLTQQKIDNSYGSLIVGSQRIEQKQTNHGQKPIDFGQEFLGQQEIDSSKLTQQSIDDSFDTGSQKIQQKPIEQEIDGSGLTQQKIDNSYGSLTVGSQRIEQKQTKYGQKPINLGQELLGEQEIDNSGLTQQSIDNSFGTLTIGNHKIQQQEIEDVDLTQQKIENNGGKLTVGSQKIEQIPIEQQEIDNFGLTQQKITSKPDQQQKDNSDMTQQEIEDDIGVASQKIEEITQQKIDNSFGTLTVGSHKIEQKPINVGQEQISQQEIEDFSKLTIGSQKIEQTPIRDQVVMQQEINDNFDPLGSQEINQKPVNYDQSQQEIDRSDITQHKVNDNFGELAIGSQKVERFDQKPIDLTQNPISLGQKIEDSSDVSQLEVGNQQYEEQIESKRKQLKGLRERADVYRNVHHRNPYESWVFDADTGDYTKLGVLIQKTEADLAKMLVKGYKNQNKITDIQQRPIKVENPQITEEIDEIESKSKQLQELKHTMNLHYQQRYENPYNSWSTNNEEQKKYEKLRALIQEIEQDLTQLRKIKHQKQDGTYFDIDSIQKSTTPKNYHYYPKYVQNMYNTGNVEVPVEPDNGKKSVMSQKDLTEASRQSQILIERIRERLRKNQAARNSYLHNTYGSSQVQDRQESGLTYGSSQVRNNYGSASHEEVENSYGPSQIQEHAIPEPHYAGTSFHPYGSTYGNHYHTGMQGHSYQYHSRDNSYGSHYHSARPEQKQEDSSEETIEHNLGVKGISQVSQNIENLDDSLEVLTTTEQPGFWKRIGNKIKHSVG